MKTLEELRKMDVKKLLTELESAVQKLFKARFETKTGQSKSNHLVKRLKQYVARIKTLIKEESTKQEEVVKKAE